jgi:hypothetical protein
MEPLALRVSKVLQVQLAHKERKAQQDRMEHKAL